MFKNMHYWFVFIFFCLSLEAKTVYRLTAKVDQAIDYQSAASQLFSIGSQIRVSNSSNGQFVDLEVVKHPEQPGIYLAAATFSLLDAVVGVPLIVTLLQENAYTQKSNTFDELRDIRGSSNHLTTRITEEHIQLQLPEGEYRLPLPPVSSPKHSSPITPAPNAAPLYTTPHPAQSQENKIFINRAQPQSKQSPSRQPLSPETQQPIPPSPLLNNELRSQNKNSDHQSLSAIDNSMQSKQTRAPKILLSNPQERQDSSPQANAFNYSNEQQSRSQQRQEEPASSEILGNKQPETSSQFFDNQKSRYLTPPALSIPAQPQSSIQKLQPSMSSNSSSQIKIPMQKQKSSPYLAPSLQSSATPETVWESFDIAQPVEQSPTQSLTAQDETTASKQATVFFVQTGVYRRIQGVKDFLKLYHDIYPYKLEKIKKQPKRLIRCLLGPFDLIEAQQVQKALGRKKRESILVKRPQH